MHNCFETKEKLLDLVFDELDPAAKAQALAQAKVCSFCQTELAALEETLQICAAATEAIEPSAKEWIAYETTLLAHFQLKTKPRTDFARFYKQIFFSSVRVPTPVLATAVLLVFGAMLFTINFSNARQTQDSAVALPASIEPESSQEVIPGKNPPERIVEKVVEKTVVRERIVRQKVFVAQKSEKAPSTSSFKPVTNLTSKPFDEINLAEFKPVSKPAPSVEKGAPEDEK